MPPRKRARHSTAQPRAPTPTTNPATARHAKLGSEKNDVVDSRSDDEANASGLEEAEDDDEEEEDAGAEQHDKHNGTAKPADDHHDGWAPAMSTALFRQLIRVKPTGLHKHMHMLSIYVALLSQGYLGGTGHAGRRWVGSPSPGTADESKEDKEDRTKEVIDNEENNRGPGLKDIWERLGDMYDLDALDEREEDGDFERAFGGPDGEPDTRDDDADEGNSSLVEPTPKKRGRKRKLVPQQQEEEERAEADADETEALPPPWLREFQLPSDDEGATDEDGMMWAKLKWQKRFPSPTPAPDMGAHAGSPGSARRGRPPRPKMERRDSSPPVMPALLGLRDEVPVRFVSGLHVDGDDDAEDQEADEKQEVVPKRAGVTAGGRGRGSRGRGGRGGRGGAKRRSSRMASVVEDSEAGDAADDDDNNDGEENSGSEQDDNDGEAGEEDSSSSSSSSSEEVDKQETPKKPRGRPPGRGRGRGGGRGRGRKK